MRTMLVSHERHVDRSGPAIGGRLGQHASAGVVVGQPIDPIERDQPGGGEDADLPHGPAEPLALDPRLADEVSRAGEQATRPARRVPSTRSR